MKLKELGAIVTGNTPSKQSVENWDSPDICFVKPDIISDTGISIIDDATEYISERARAKARIVGENSILITCIGSIGKIGITAKGTFAFNQQINAIIPNHKINSKYLAYALLYAKPRLVAIANAPVVPIINKSQFGDFEIKITENTEYQRKVVEVLDTVNAIIENKRQQLQKLDELVKALFVEMFGSLVVGNKIQTNKKKIGEIASVTKLAGFEFTKYIQYKEHGEIIMLRGLNCKKGKLVLDDVKWIDRETSDLLPRSKLYYGDILMTYAGTIGDVAMVDKNDKYHLAPNVAKITINDQGKYNPIFLMYLFLYSNEYIMTFASQVAQASINMEKIRNFEYYFPDITSQNKFVAFVTQVDKSKVAVQKSLDEAQLLFDSLMQQYFG